MRSSSLLLSSILSSAVLAAGALGTGCASDGASPGQVTDATTIQLPLLRQAGTNIYRLSATFQITEADGTVISVDGTGDDASVSVEVTPGIDKIELLDGWSLSKSTDGGTTFSPVNATLSSSPQVNLVIRPNSTASWEFDFIVVDATSTLQLGFGVFDAPAQLSFSMFVTAGFGSFKSYSNTQLQAAILFPAFSSTQTEPDGTHDRVYGSGATAIQVYGDQLGLLQPVVKQLAGGFLDMTISADATGAESLSGNYSSGFLGNGGTFPTLTFAADQLFGAGVDGDGFPIDGFLSGFGSGFVLTNNGSPILAGQVDILTYTPGAPNGQTVTQP